MALLLAASAGLGASDAGAEPARQTAQRQRKRPARPKAPQGRAPAALGQQASAEHAARPPVEPPISVDRWQLDNGLRVVLAPARRAPRVAVAMLYDVGARNEERGSAGLAHLVEKLMTQGSANVPRGEHDRLLSARGGRSSSRTENDRTWYVDEASASELPLLLWLEADRLKSLQMTQDALTTQRASLLAELSREQAAPLDAARTRLRELVFQASWPIEHDPRGLPADIAQLRLEQAQTFHETYYVASNAVLVITGDFDTEHATQLVHRFFETARKQERPAPLALPLQHEQSSQRLAVLEDARLTSPALLFGWAAPMTRTDDGYALRAALDILAQGPSARLAQRLMSERQLATDVTPFIERQRGQALLGLRVALVDDAKRAEAERIVEQELDALVKAGPSEAELARYRAHAEADAWELYDDEGERARALGEIELMHGDARLAADELSRAFGVTREHVRAAVGRYLIPSRRTLVEALPPASERASKPHQAPVAQPAGKGHPVRTHKGKRR